MMGRSRQDLEAGRYESHSKQTNRSVRDSWNREGDRQADVLDC